MNTEKPFNPCIIKCQHESDGIMYNLDPPNELKNKCKKCGEFYPLFCIPDPIENE